jgi:hypothetical protein
MRWFQRYKLLVVPEEICQILIDIRDWLVSKAESMGQIASYCVGRNYIRSFFFRPKNSTLLQAVDKIENKTNPSSILPRTQKIFSFASSV